MTVLLNGAEGGTNGTTVTAANSGSASGNAFDSVSNTGTNAVNIFDSTRSAHGILSYKFATGSTSTTSYDRWVASLGTQPQIWFRAYFYFTANPAVDVRVLSGIGGSTLTSALYVSSAGKLYMTDTSGSSKIITTSTVPLNQWFRVEGYITGSATVGQVELKLFSSMDSTTPTETQTSAANLNTFGSNTEIRYGVTISQANVAAFWADDVGVSSTGYIGPFPPASSLTDTFLGGSINTGIWNTSNGGGLFTETATGLQVKSPATAVYNNIASVGNFNLAGSSFSARLKSIGTSANVHNIFYTRTTASGNNKFYWEIDDRTISLQAWKDVNGVTTLIGALNAFAFPISIRIRESAGTVFWEYSNDGVSWTVLASIANPFVLTSMQAGIQIGADVTPGAQTTSTWDYYGGGVPVVMQASLAHFTSAIGI